jgi:hypothetical protein
MQSSLGQHLYRVGITLGASALFTLTACSAEAPPGAPSEDDAVESIGSIKSELIVSVTDPAAYLTSCWDTLLAEDIRSRRRAPGGDLSE